MQSGKDKKTMNVFQIWIERPDKPTSEMFGWIKTVIDKMQTDSQYNLYSSNNYFSDDSRVKWTDIGSVESEMLKGNPELEKIFGGFIPELKAECLRFYIASILWDPLWLDCDVEVIEWPKLETAAGLYLAPFRGTSMADCHIFFSKDKEVMKKLFSEHSKKLIEMYPVGYSFTFWFLQNFVKFKELKSGSFVHHNRL
jgi:hypothetical protein